MPTPAAHRTFNQLMGDWPPNTSSPALSRTTTRRCAGRPGTLAQSAANPSEFRSAEEVPERTRRSGPSPLLTEATGTSFPVTGRPPVTRRLEGSATVCVTGADTFSRLFRITAASPSAQPWAEGRGRAEAIIYAVTNSATRQWSAGFTKGTGS